MTPTDVHQHPEALPRATRRNRRRGVRAVVVGLAGLGLLVAAGCSSGSTSTPTTSASGSTAAGGASATPSIAISNYKFVPATLRVGPGEKITVTNHDAVAHTVTSASGMFDTGNIQPGASVTVTAPTKAGSFPYICSIHQFMTGTVTVT